MEKQTMTASSSLLRLNYAFGAVALGLSLSVVGISTGLHVLDWAGLVFSFASSFIAYMSFKQLKSSIKEIANVCDQAAKGNLEPRVILLPDGGDVKVLANSVNHLLDMADAFVRESKASFAAVEKGNFNRRIVERGILGTYDIAAKGVNTAIIAMDKRFSDFAELIASAEETTQRVLGHVVEASSRLKDDSYQMLSASHSAQDGVSNIGQSASATTEDAHLVANSASALSASSGEIDSQLMHSVNVNMDAEAKIAQTRQAMNSLTLAMKEIGPIANIIREVAGQTRLLALNASIEAVRAGEAGVAFAVVAGEVKSLADQTANASEDIVSRIGGIERTANIAQETIESFVKTVEELTSISDQISQAVSNQLQSSNNISDAIRNTASRSDEVKGQVNNVLAAIRQTSSQAENLSQAAVELENEASQLNEELGQFLYSARKIVGAAR
jgi:methyl-accepting chemotaxis protein